MQFEVARHVQMEYSYYCKRERESKASPQGGQDDEDPRDQADRVPEPGQRLGAGPDQDRLRREDRKTLESFKVRNGSDALVKLADKMKAEGYQSVSWGAVGTGYWIGETFQPAN